MPETSNVAIRGKILHVDLTNQFTREETISREITDLLLGGKGLGIYLLLRTPARCDPLGPDNDVILVTGPLTGTLSPCACKFGIVTKSPATCTFLDAYSSGRIGAATKQAGYDAIVLHGIAPSQQAVVITDDNVEFHDAGKLDIAGRAPVEIDARLRERFGMEYACACIGLAGERMSLVAGIFADQRCAGRGGAGAVLGSKNVKALAVKGTKPIMLRDPAAFRSAAWVARRYIRSGESTVRAMPLFGTANIVDVVNATHVLPTKNFQGGHFADADLINGPSWREHYWTEPTHNGHRSGNIACQQCPISCSKIARSKDLPGDGNPDFPETLPELDYEIVIDGPEYETIYALGSNIGNADKETLLKANYLCDHYGIDTISTGVIIGMLMEMHERGIIDQDDLDGIVPAWGDASSILQLIRKIGTREGCGATIGQGVRVIARQWPDAAGLAMHVKGLELPGYDPRHARGMALCYAVSDRGACHLHAFTASVEAMGNAGGADPFDLGPKKLDLFLNMQAESTLVDTAIVCFFTLNGLQTKEIIGMLHAAVGDHVLAGPGAVRKHAARVLALTRLYNYREGLTAADDALPARISSEMHVEGPAKNVPFPDFAPVLQSYYSAMGWDSSGKPTLETIESLGLKAIMQDLERGESGT
ncbi:MAG TPA: aldehyde ferredoxin oxidoreductase C-terminal domain-containing protein [Candidatus Lokiarchaeia archaeon]|nr:aldehyde ferredoxin oxidoreductase C-terminal domain-containing protein [Candidatus Lokiarchaeia archaeon]